MARVTVEDCLENVDNRFELIMVSSKRARQLATGGKEAHIDWKMTSAQLLLYVKSPTALLTPASLTSKMS